MTPPPGGPVTPPPRKGKVGLIVLIVVIVIVLIGAGVTAAVIVGNSNSNASPTPTPNTGSNNPSTSPTSAVTPTTSVPAGFKQFSNSQFSISYPETWTASASSDNSEQFTGPTGQVFQVNISPHATSGQESLFNSTFCSILGGSSSETQTPTAITISGQQWQQLDCGEHNGLHAVVESVAYKDNLYSLAYVSSTITFANDKAQFYSVMEQSFAFAS